MQHDALHNLLPAVKELAQQAGQAILDIYDSVAEQNIEYKNDGSPLTEADKVANAIITQGLMSLTPDIPVLSEEGADIPYSERASWQRYWLVDPLDGTREFIQRTGDFTVNIALIERQHSILGVVYVPTTGVCYFAAKTIGAFKEAADQFNPIQVSQVLPKKIRIVASRLHAKEKLAVILDKLPDYELKTVGSSLKFCLVAEGEADIYPRLGITSEWDTAAAQCIVEQAGGVVIDLYGLPLHYNVRDSLQNPYFLVLGNKAQFHWQEYFSRDVIE